MSQAFKKYLNFLPKEFNIQSNPMFNALISAWSGADDELLEQLKNTKAQLFVKTAEGTYLDRIASNFGVSRPVELGLLDQDFQKLIPNLSLKQKQISSSFYDTMDVFWGPEFSRAGATSTLNAPFGLQVGDTLTLVVDGGEAQSVTVTHGDVRISGGVTTVEVIKILSKLSGITVEEVEDVTTGLLSLAIRTNTAGLRGSIEFVQGFDVLGFTQGIKIRVTSLPQRTVLYQIKPGEVVIELPAIVPTLRRTLKGSHHFHADSTIEPAIPGIWQGSFVYSRDSQPFVPTSKMSNLLNPILKGSTVSEITVEDASLFPPSGGKLVFSFGTKFEEQPVSYITVPNNNTILVDPGYTFQNNHEIGASVNFLMAGIGSPYKPSLDGKDLAVYLTSPAKARNVVQEILQSLAAAGITVSFVVLLPKYKYIIDNPYNVSV